VARKVGEDGRSGEKVGMDRASLMRLSGERSSGEREGSVEGTLSALREGARGGEGEGRCSLVKGFSTLGSKESTGAERGLTTSFGVRQVRGREGYGNEGKGKLGFGGLA
jgi:hypothetical protein